MVIENFGYESLYSYNGWYLASYWTYRIYVLCPTRYFTDAAGNIFTA